MENNQFKLNPFTSKINIINNLYTFYVFYKNADQQSITVVQIHNLNAIFAGIDSIVNNHKDIIYKESTFLITPIIKENLVISIFPYVGPVLVSHLCLRDAVSVHNILLAATSQSGAYSDERFLNAIADMW